MTLYTLRPISDRTPFTGRHVYSDFDSTWASTERLLARELRAISARNVVLELDYRERDIRVDGQLRADARCQSPAVRLAFDSKHGPLVYATDRFEARYSNDKMQDWQHNVRAIALGLEALRKVDRYGITRRGEQYAGWKALPPGSAIAVASHMTSEAAATLIAELSDAEDASIVHDLIHNPTARANVLRRVKAKVHPDRNGGDRTLWDQVEQASRVLERSA
jgi:hypothetical protein